MLGVALNRERLHSASRTGVDFTDNRSPVTTGIVDPLTLATVTTGLEVNLGAGQVLDRPNLDDDLATGSVGRSYGTTDIASIHS